MPGRGQVKSNQQTNHEDASHHNVWWPNDSGAQPRAARGRRNEVCRHTCAARRLQRFVRRLVEDDARFEVRRGFLTEDKIAKYSPRRNALINLFDHCSNSGSKHPPRTEVSHRSAVVSPGQFTSRCAPNGLRLSGALFSVRSSRLLAGVSSLRPPRLAPILLRISTRGHHRHMVSIHRMTNHTFAQLA